MVVNRTKMVTVQFSGNFRAIFEAMQWHFEAALPFLSHALKA